MLKSGVFQSLIAGLACVLAGSKAEAQTPIEGDPTPDNIVWCTTHVIPSNAIGIFGFTNHDICDDHVSSPLGYLQGSQSWIEQNGSWVKDRRPLMMIQMGSFPWSGNSRGNPDWWYGDFSTLGVNTPQPSDEARDLHTPKTGDYESDTDWVATNDGPNGIPDQFDILIRHVKRGAYYGIRRFVMHIPAGVLGAAQKRNAAGQLVFDPTSGLPVLVGTNQSMNQFHGMPDWKQAYFRDYYGAWQQFIRDYCTLTAQNQDPYSIEVYVGGGIGLGTSTPASFCGIGTQPTYDDGGDHSTRKVYGVMGYTSQNAPIFGYWWREYYANHTEPYPMHPGMSQNIEAFWRQVAPWFADLNGYLNAGAKTVWLDACSDNADPNARRWGAVEMAHNPWLAAHGVRIGGETFPNADPYNETLDDCAVGNMRWLGNSQIALLPDALGVRRCRWTLDPYKSEVHVLDNMDWMGWVQWKDAREKGFVVGTWNVYNSNDVFGQYHSKQGELLKRWYSVGQIRVADFNGDGYVDASDLGMAHAAIDAGLANPNLWPIVFGNGDIDGDGHITEADRTFFDLYWAAHPNDTYDYTNKNHDY